jgi:xanthine dehydrogenase YagS FAD-binding subunit
MLIALDASVNILGPDGNRNMKLQDFYVLPEDNPYNETVLGEQEILTEVIVPLNGKKSHYLKFRERKSIDFALVSVSVAANVSDEKVSDIHIALGGVAPVPWRAAAAEKILEGHELDQDLMEKAAEAELKNAEPLAQNKFKMTLVKKLLPLAISELMEA